MTGETALGESRLSKDWRQRNPVGPPDRGFVKQLKMLDSEFEVVWDVGSEKWEIWKFPRDRAGYHILTVQTTGRTYRELGTDILLQMQKIIDQHFNAEKIMNYLVEADRQERRRKEKDFMNKMEAIALDTFNFARGILQVSVPETIGFETPKATIIERMVKNES